MNQALYPVDKIEWCVYALYKQDTERIGSYCTIVTMFDYVDTMSLCALNGNCTYIEDKLKEASSS